MSPRRATIVAASLTYLITALACCCPIAAPAVPPAPEPAAQVVEAAQAQPAPIVPPPAAKKDHEPLLDATKDHADVGDWRVRVTRVRVDQNLYERSKAGVFATFDQPETQIFLQVINLSPTLRQTYRAFHDEGAPTLADDVGNSYARVRPRLGRYMTFGDDSDPKARFPQELRSASGRQQLDPGALITDIVVFARPVAPATRLTLTLPADNVGGRGQLRFAIPRAMWQPAAKDGK